MAKKKRETPAGAPEWMVTFSDMMTLLLCFFVIIVAMSEVKKDKKYYEVLKSLKAAFGGKPSLLGATPELETPLNTIIEDLSAISLSTWTKKKGDTDVEGVQDVKWRVTDVRKGVKVEIGGHVSFERFSATLLPDAKILVAKAAETMRGQNLKITVRGHATREPLPSDSPYADPWDLSYARAKAVTLELAHNGILPQRILCVATGDTEPLVAQAYNEERRAMNRRVEIVVTEDSVDDYVGEPIETGNLVPEDERKADPDVASGPDVTAGPDVRQENAELQQVKKTDQ